MLFVRYRLHCCLIRATIFLCLVDFWNTFQRVHGMPTLPVRRRHFPKRQNKKSEVILMLQKSNPYNVLSENIPLDNIQKMAELNTIELLNLKPRDRVVLDCYMAGMTCHEIAEFLDIDRITVTTMDDIIHQIRGDRL